MQERGSPTPSCETVVRSGFTAYGDRRGQYEERSAPAIAGRGASDLGRDPVLSSVYRRPDTGGCSSSPRRPSRGAHLVPAIGIQGSKQGKTLSCRIGSGSFAVPRQPQPAQGDDNQGHPFRHRRLTDIIREYQGDPGSPARLRF